LIKKSFDYDKGEQRCVFKIKDFDLLKANELSPYLNQTALFKREDQGHLFGRFRFFIKGLNSP
jgi:hypothetical protein